MNKKIIITFSSIFLIIFALGGYIFYKDYRVRHAYKLVELNRKEVEVFENIKLKDLIKSINGTIIKNIKIDTTKVGKKEIEFEYITDKEIKVPYKIEINIVDKTPPIIYEPSSYSVIVGSTTKEELEKSFFCGDNYDNNPKCTLLGDFNLEEIGTYDATFQGEDSSGNKKEYTFPLTVKEKSNNKSNNTKEEPTPTEFTDIVNSYKTDNTKIGIDVSHWQGEIDYKKLKDSKVEFAYIRIGRGDGIGKDYVLDDKFINNIKGFNKEKIPVGIYFYSYANSKKDAIKEAKWILSKIKKHKVDLEIVYDWENWSHFQDFDLSFYNLTETYKAFQKTIEKAGYKAMLYSSKTYLESIWYPLNSNIWLAHYTNKTNYKGKYKVWQICNDGHVDGINDNYVDIDIMVN